jgi:hypothetical protein
MIALNVHGQIIVQSGLTHRLATPPSGIEHVPISLKNVGNTAMRCSLEKRDVVSTCDSGYQYLECGVTAQSCASWMTLEQEQFDLEPGEEKIIKVLFECPQDYPKAGAKASVLVHSAPVNMALERGALKVRVRYAINFLYRNPFVPGIVALHAEQIHMEREQPFWALTFQNTGNVDRVVRSHAKLLNADGEVVYSQPSESARGLIPNQCRTLRFATPEVPKGTYQMVVISETDQGERFGITSTLEWGL